MGKNKSPMTLERKKINKLGIIKPCPFCGGEAKLKRSNHVQTVPVFFVQCTKCYAKSASMDLVYDDFKANYKYWMMRPVSDWNKRNLSPSIKNGEEIKSMIDDMLGDDNISKTDMADALIKHLDSLITPAKNEMRARAYNNVEAIALEYDSPVGYHDKSYIKESYDDMNDKIKDVIDMLAERVTAL